MFRFKGRHNRLDTDENDQAFILALINSNIHHARDSLTYKYFTGAPTIIRFLLWVTVISESKTQAERTCQPFVQLNLSDSFSILLDKRSRITIKPLLSNTYLLKFFKLQTSKSTYKVIPFENRIPTIYKTYHTKINKLIIQIL